MSDEISYLDSKNFDKFIQKGNVVVDFWAEWCGPCKMLGPHFEAVAKDLAGEVKFGKVDIEKDFELAERFSVMSIPALIFFKDGEMVDQTVGAYPKEELKAKIKEVFY